MKATEDKKKNERDVNVAKEWVKLFLGIALAIFGMGIITYSLVVPAVGAIHATVVTTFGTILTFVGTMFGIDSNTKIKMHEQDIDFELKSRELDEKMRRFDRRYEEIMEKENEGSV